MTRGSLSPQSSRKAALPFLNEPLRQLGDLEYPRDDRPTPGGKGLTGQGKGDLLAGLEFRIEIDCVAA